MFQNRIFQQMQWWLIFVSTPRHCGTKIGRFESFAEIVFEIYIYVGNKVDSLVTVLTN